jgi:uncharacterized protein DUF1841
VDPDLPSAEVRARREFAVPPLPAGSGEEIDWLDLADPLEREVIIADAHPDLARAIEAGLNEVETPHGLMNPRLHLAMHEIVANQICDDDPPEVWATAQRLSAAGYDRHEVLHMLAGAMAGLIWTALHEHAPYDPELHRAALAALPESWEAERAEKAGRTGGAATDRGGPGAARRPRQPRRRGRRGRRRR